MNELNRQDVEVKIILEFDEDALFEKSLSAAKAKLEIFQEWMKYEFGEDSNLSDQEAQEVQEYLMNEKKGKTV